MRASKARRLRGLIGALAECLKNEETAGTTSLLTSMVTIIPEWVHPGDINGYAKGDKVTHDGRTWISLLDCNTWVPGESGWEECI